MLKRKSMVNDAPSWQLPTSNMERLVHHQEVDFDADTP